jgi:hypothetical protein
MSRRPPQVCTCPEHEGGAQTVYGTHEFKREERETELGRCWRAVCSCGGYRSVWQYQSESVAYHAWLRHIAKIWGKAVLR